MQRAASKGQRSIVTRGSGLGDPPPTYGIDRKYLEQSLPDWRSVSCE